MTGCGCADTVVGRFVAIVTQSSGRRPMISLAALFSKLTVMKHLREYLVGHRDFGSPLA